jgi:predicted dehydrogenase
MQKLSRRTFLSSIGLTGASLYLGSSWVSGKVPGANETIQIGVAGLNGRGGDHINAFLAMKNVRIAYLIDPDKRTWPAKVKLIQEKAGYTPRTVQDIRQALEDKDLDAVSIATPNHWHSLLAIWACQAGKDVYVEKPCSHNVREGRILVETARRYDRIVQHGTQSRTGTLGVQARELAKSGQYGKLLVSRGLCYKPRVSIGFKPAKTPPSELDFNIWLGPAPEQPFHENLVHYNWHWFWDTGNGDIGNNGVHQMDIARWGIPGATLPKSVISLGGRFGYTDQGQTPNTQIAIFDFGATQLVFEVRGLTTTGFKGQNIENFFHFEKGTLTGGKFTPKEGGEAIKLPTNQFKLGPGDNHFANFIAAVRSHKKSDLNAEVLEGHYSSALCHLANISYRLGELVPFNPKTKAFGDNKEAYETLARMEEHLDGENGLKLDGLQYRLGRKLIIDAKSEKIVNDPEASKLLTCEYRKPFVVPNKV